MNEHNTAIATNVITDSSFLRLLCSELLTLVFRCGAELFDTGPCSHLPERTVQLRITGVVHQVGHRDTKLLLLLDVWQRLVGVAL